MSGNLIDLRNRIKSVKNTQKITRAMKTVSAAKLRKSVMELNKARPFLTRVESVLGRLAKDVNPADFPLMQEKSAGDVMLVVLTSDKGLCGSFNSHVLRQAEVKVAELEKEGRSVKLITIGNRGNKYFRRTDAGIQRDFPNLMTKIGHDDVLELSAFLQDSFVSQNTAEIDFIYTEFQSAGRQEVVSRQLFPVSCSWDESENESDEDIEFIYEPSVKAIFQSMLPFYLDSRIYHLLLESQASEHAARMMAMDLASRNASEMIESLTLTMNKLRQASITNELLEIITATEALNK